METKTRQLTAIDRDLVSRLGEVLRRHEYLGWRILSRVPHRGEPTGIEAPWALCHEFDADNPFDALVMLFYIQGSIPVDTAERHFSTGLLGGLIDLGLLAVAPDGDRIHSLVDIFSFEERYFMTDPCRVNALHQPEWLRRRLPAADRVMYIGEDSVLLAQGTVRKQRSRVLDLCTGSGIHAILAASDSDHVTGVDINSRALRFSNLNAALNHCPDVSFLLGDLYQPVGDDRIDLVLANPPFVAGFDIQLLFRDGGVTGEDILARIVAGLPEKLEVGGMCQIVSDLAVHADQSYERKLRGWLGEGGEAWDILLTILTRSSLNNYALAHLILDDTELDTAAKAERFGAMMEGFHRAGLVHFDFGLINICRRPAGEQGWFHEKKLKEITSSIGDSIGEFFERCGRFSLDDLFEAMMPLRPRLMRDLPVSRLNILRPEAPPMEGVIRALPAHSPWADEDLVLSPESCRLLSLCDGSRTVAGIVEFSHPLGKRAPAAHRIAVADQVRRFYEAGLVDLDGETHRGSETC